MRKCLKCLWSPFLLQYLLFPSLHLYPYGELPPITNWGREILGLVYRWFCTICKCHPKVDSYSTTAPLWDTPVVGGEGDSSQWAEPQEVYLVVHFVWKEKQQKHKWILIQGLWLTVRLDCLAQGLGRNMIGKSVTRRFGEDMACRPLWMGEKCENIVFHVNADQRLTSAEGDFDNQVDTMTWLVDTSQPFFPATSVITQWAHGPKGHGSRDGGYTGAQW